MSMVPGIESGNLVNVVIKAVAGSQKTATTAVNYDPNSNAIASYTCKGATLTYSCTLNGE
jgi:hypothetical protein